MADPKDSRVTLTAELKELPPGQYREKRFVGHLPWVKSPSLKTVYAQTRLDLIRKLTRNMIQAIREQNGLAETIRELLSGKIKYPEPRVGAKRVNLIPFIDKSIKRLMKPNQSDSSIHTNTPPSENIGRTMSVSDPQLFLDEGEAIKQPTDEVTADDLRPNGTVFDHMLEGETQRSYPVYFVTGADRKEYVYIPTFQFVYDYPELKLNATVPCARGNMKSATDIVKRLLETCMKNGLRIPPAQYADVETVGYGADYSTVILPDQMALNLKVYLQTLPDYHSKYTYNIYTNSHHAYIVFPDISDGQYEIARKKVFILLRIRDDRLAQIQFKKLTQDALNRALHRQHSLKRQQLPTHPLCKHYVDGNLTLRLTGEVGANAATLKNLVHPTKQSPPPTKTKPEKPPGLVRAKSGIDVNALSFGPEDEGDNQEHLPPVRSSSNASQPQKRAVQSKKQKTPERLPPLGSGSPLVRTTSGDFSLPSTSAAQSGTVKTKEGLRPGTPSPSRKAVPPRSHLYRRK